jgi:uncharacterized protein DUF3883
VDDVVAGSDWTVDELAAVVSDYFSMLQAELEGRRYSKTVHRRALLSSVRRSKGSIEFKHQNISAVLQALGLPWIAGYKPRAHKQGALADAIGDYLNRHPFSADALMPPLQAPKDDLDAIFVAPPVLGAGKRDHPAVARLVRKFDPAARDAHNRRLGKAGEEFVFKLERVRLARFGREELAKKVRWVAEADGDGAGYDILSYDKGGAERLLEVKTTCGAERTPFYLTRNELALSEERPTDFRLVRVHQFANDPKIFVLAPPLADHLRVEAVTFRAGWDCRGPATETGS